MRGYALTGDQSFLGPVRATGAGRPTRRSRGSSATPRWRRQRAAAAARRRDRRAPRRWQREYGEPTRELVRRDPLTARSRCRRCGAGKAALRRVPQRGRPAAVAADPAREDAPRPARPQRRHRARSGCSGRAIVVLLSVAAVALVLRGAIVNAAPATRRRRAHASRAATSTAPWPARARARCVDLGEDVETMRARIVGGARRALRDAECRPAALQRRARAVRLRRLARPPGAAAQGRVASASCCSSATAGSSTSAPTSTSASRSTARGACRT